jgi:hypothetical protein
VFPGHSSVAPNHGRDGRHMQAALDNTHLLIANLRSTNRSFFDGLYVVDHAQVLLSIDDIQHADSDNSKLEKVVPMCVSGMSECGGKG